MAEFPNVKTPAVRYALSAALALGVCLLGPYSSELIAISTGMLGWRAAVAGVAVGTLSRDRDSAWLGPLIAASGVVAARLVLLALYPDTPLAALDIAWVAVAPLAALGASYAVRHGQGRAVAGLGVALVALSLLWQVGVLPGAPRTALASFHAYLATDPVPEQYGFDGGVWEYTTTQMKRGVGYTEAVHTAFLGHSGFDVAPASVLNYPQRWLFDIWRAMPGTGRSAPWRTMLLFALSILPAGYGLVRRYAHPAVALVAPTALASYYAYPLLSQWTTFDEYYGGGLAVVALWLLATKRWTWAAVALSAAVAGRELMFILVPVFVVAWALDADRRENWPALAIALVVPAGLLAYHWMVAAPGQGLSGASSFRAWFQNGGYAHLRDSLKFSTDFIPGASWRKWILAGLALASVSLGRTWSERAVLLGFPLATLTLLFLFSNSIYDYYWGAIAMPIVLALAPAMLGWIAPKVATQKAKAANPKPKRR